MSQWLRKLTSILAKTWTTAIFLNQIRSKIWVMFGNPETTTWWNALKFFASQRIEIRRWEKLEESKEQIGYKAKVKVVKNKIAPPFKTAEIIIRFNQWIDKIADIVETAMFFGFVTRSGAFYTIWEQKVQGKEKLYSLIKENEQVRQNLEKEIQNKIKAIRIWKEEIPEEVLEEKKSEEI